jgi:antitoxin HicB
MRAVKFAAIFEPQPEGGYTVTFSDIPEAITEGDTKDECLHNAQEVLTLCLEQRMDDGETIPDASTVKGGIWIEPSAAMQAAVLVRAWRTKQGKTVSEIARTLNTSWAAAQKLESHRANPTLRQLERTAAALGKRLHVEMV